MKIEQRYWTESEGWQTEGVSTLDSDAQWVLVFGGTEKMRESAWLHDTKQRYPKALIMGCSTAGEICATRVRDESLVATAVQFEHIRIEMAQALDQEGLTHVLVLSDGLKVNGSELAKGLRENLPARVAVTGGLAGDGGNFARTLVCADGNVAEGKIVALGFYGERLKVGYGSFGGWDVFGPESAWSRNPAAMSCTSWTASRRWSCTRTTWAVMRRACLPRLCCFHWRCATEREATVWCVLCLASTRQHKA